MNFYPKVWILKTSLFNIVNEDGIVIGMIWYAKKDNGEGFISDFIIYESYRGKGYGKKALEIIESDAKKNGIKKLMLHVFGHNKIAISLYQKMGYIPFSIHMAKELE